jgi:hypothetical protein
VTITAQDEPSASQAIRALMHQVANREVTPEFLAKTAKLSRFIVQLIEFSAGKVDAVGLIAEGVNSRVDRAMALDMARQKRALEDDVLMWRRLAGRLEKEVQRLREKTKTR